MPIEQNIQLHESQSLHEVEPGFSQHFLHKCKKTDKVKHIPGYLLYLEVTSGNHYNIFAICRCNWQESMKIFCRLYVQWTGQPPQLIEIEPRNGISFDYDSNTDEVIVLNEVP